MNTLKMANLALRFALEICLLVALGSWGWNAGGTLPLKLLLAVGAPLAAAVVWGLFIAPRATIAVPLGVWLLLQLLLFGLALAGLVAAGHPALAIAFAIALAFNATLLYIFR
jgi:hypothetical protein